MADLHKDRDHIGKICNFSKKEHYIMPARANLISFAFENHWQQEMLDAAYQSLPIVEDKIS
jgi:hypothetical protein